MSPCKTPLLSILMVLNICSGCDSRSKTNHDHLDLEIDLSTVAQDMNHINPGHDLDGITLVEDAGVATADSQISSNELDGRVDELIDMTLSDMDGKLDLSVVGIDAGVIDMMITEIDGGSELDMTTATTGPQVCDLENMGQCECTSQPGFTTYTWDVAGQQRCFTVYTPESDEPLPVVIQMNCYAQNNLRAGGCTPNSELIEAANTFGFVAVCASSTDGDWTFGNDGVSNDDLPTPCAEEDSKDISYLGGLLNLLDQLGTQQVVDASRIYTSGFSQNSMFAAYAAICFPEQIHGVWQGGSGLFVAGETNPLPQMEGACRRSDFLVHGPSCVDITPCEECQYFPAYPVSTVSPRRVCVMAYEDDFLFPTARPMYDRLVLEGHDATLLSFPDIGRGHASPLQEWAWIVSCLGISPMCNVACSTAVLNCMTDEMSTPNPPVDPGPHPCGDNVCDQVERNNPRLCPRDCEERPDDFDWCGDGLCDALENHQSSCPRDCGSQPTQDNVEALVDRYDRCLRETTECTLGCAATREMLTTVEQAIIDEPMP